MDISDDAPKLVCGPNGLGLASGLNVSGVRSGDHPICFPVDPDVHFGRRTGLHVMNSLTGKKMELPIKKLLLGQAIEKVANPDAMANPDSIAFYSEFAERRGTAGR